MLIYVLSTLEIGIDSINILIKHLDIRGIIGLSERNPNDSVSGYRYLKPYCEENNLEFIEVSSYSLSSQSDKEKLLELDIDILIVFGWQRIIPSWLIEHTRICVIGSHGSVRGITSGRGRSPQNWALLLGKNEFHISIFRIDEGIDSGPIIDTKSFVVSNLDDIKTTYYKVGWLTSHMIISNIRNGKVLSNNNIKQEGEAKYLPQRLPEDGEIDWSRTSYELYDFIRALTKPYPGAFSFVGTEKVKIWKARPIEITENINVFEFGEIVNVYSNRDFLVKTGDSLLLIEDYSISSNGTELSLTEGNILSSCDFKKQVSNIIDRHYHKYPTLTLSDDIMGVVGNK